MATLSMTSTQLDAYRYMTDSMSAGSGWQVGSMPCNNLSTTTATLAAWQDQATAQQQTYQYQYYVQVPNWANAMSSAIRKIKFWRVNQVVEMDEGASFQDPLDELRLKVARWLKPKESYNFA